MMRFCAIMIAAVFSVQPLPQADGPLEPSIQNEVDHAIDMGERWLEKNFKGIGRGTCPACPLLRGMRDPTEIGNTRDCNGLKAQLGLTNGQTRADIALKLVSTQKGGGWWLVETNSVPTRLAIKILKGL